MPRPRFNKLTEDRRSELLESAANEFARHGYDGASLNNIISGIGLSKGSFYYYFDDKADLFQTVTDYAFDSVARPNEITYDFEALDGESFWPSLERWFLELNERLQELPWLAGLGKLVYQPHGDDIGDIVASRFARAYAWLTAVLHHGRAVGAVRTDAPLELLLAMVFGALEASDRWFVEHWDRLEAGEREQLAATAFALAKSMVEGPTSAVASQ